MKAIGYIRVSTQEQANSGLSLESQRQRIEDYCKLRDLELVEILSDEGVSGGKNLATRPGGAKVVEWVKTKTIGAVVITKLDRAFRRAADCLNTIEPWLRRGCTLHILDLGGNAIDTSTAAGKFMLTTLAAAAEMERGFISERTKAALDIMKQQGKIRSRHIPYGYERDPKDPTRMRKCAVEQKLLKKIRKLADLGCGPYRISHMFNRKGIPSRCGEQWHREQVVRIMRREGIKRAKKPHPTAC